jgi:large subunit ribosomal protein L31
MKQTIHPTYYPNAVFTCTCGNTFVAGSTMPQVHVDICSACHPFFTGEAKYVDLAGRVDKFKAKQAAVKGQRTTSKKQKRVQKIAAKRRAAEMAPVTLREMLKPNQQTAKATATKPKSTSKGADDSSVAPSSDDDTKDTTKQ